MHINRLVSLLVPKAVCGFYLLAAGPGSQDLL